MKKILSIFLAIMMVLSLVACGGNKGTEGIIYDLSVDGTYAEVLGYDGAERNLVIASKYKGVPVTKIYEKAFEESKILSVEMPDSITHIGESAFDSCEKLEKVVVSKNLINIEEKAFYCCESLQELSFYEGLKIIEESAFWGCNLKSLSIPSSVKRIGKNITDGDGPKLITFAGTKKQWEGANINNPWDDYVGVTVSCSDGDIDYPDSYFGSFSY